MDIGYTARVVLTPDKRVYVQVKLCDKRDDFYFKIVNFTFMFIKIKLSHYPLKTSYLNKDVFPLLNCESRAIHAKS